MGMLSYGRRLATVVTETSLLVSALDGADLSVAVRSRPGWTLNQLLRHLGFAHRSIGAAHAVEGYAGETPAQLAPWLTEGAALFGKTLREAPLDEPLGPAFWSRRMAHETWMHRFTAFEALGLPFAVEPDVAWDGLWEWMNSSFPLHAERPAVTELLGHGHKLRFFASDYDTASNRWTVDLTGSTPVVKRDAKERCTVYVRAPVADLVLTLNGRRVPARSEVTGDKALLREFLYAVN
ncbi:maleylpyruvate isomerase family mycothiol-dependent enzyme [Streptomyces sp. ID05-26A]|nr:maleylpyruvate isomerase family mycothiol-dependent enzyme [Streptomyces sp. ID05-26A]